MGGDSSITKKLLPRLVPVDLKVPSAFDPSRIPVCFQDYLIAHKRLDPTVETTLGAVFDTFFDAVRRVLLNEDSPVEIFIMGCDDRSNVTKYKKRTQAIRQATTATVFAETKPYTPNDPLNLVARSDAVELRRLKITDPSDKCLWRAFIPLIQAEMSAFVPGAGKERTFIFDFDETLGSLVFQTDSPKIGIIPKGAIGEADPSFIWWMHNLPQAKDDRGYDFHCISSDGDIIAIYAFYHAKAMLRGQRAFLHRNGLSYGKEQIYGDHYNVVQSDMIDLTRTMQIIEKNHMPAPWFGVFFIFMGDDFVERQKFAPRFGVDAIFDVFCTAITIIRMWDELKHDEAKLASAFVVHQERFVLTLKSCKPPCPTHGTTEDLIKWLLRITYLGSSSTVVQVPPKDRKPIPMASFVATMLAVAKKRKATQPSETEIAEEIKRIEFNILYWGHAPTAYRPDLDPKHACFYRPSPAWSAKRKREPTPETEKKRLKC